MPKRSTTFAHDESGAVTVDWTVMTAAIVGLGIATYGVVSGGISDLSSDVDFQLRTNHISTSFGPNLLASMDFSGGERGGWIGGSILSPIEALGEMLVLGPGETANVTLDVPPGSSQATLSFDLIGGDSLDNEIATITSNGTTVTLARGLHNGTMTFTTPDVEGVTVTTETISSGTNIGGASPDSWRDSVTRVTVTVDDPGETLALGMTSGANQHIGDEFFGIDNVGISAQ
jgi:hypothetical protein